MDQAEHDSDATATATGQRKPVLLIFDVNETLSDMGPMADRFSQVGASGATAKTWFASLLRDGFALTVHGVNPEFASLARDQLRQTLASAELTGSLDDAVEHVMSGFSELFCHPDVVEGVHALADLGLRLVTFSNGSAQVARRLLTSAGIADQFEAFLSVEQAAVWKPGRAAYAHALEHCRVDAADAMLVAVHPWDTDGARRAGLATAWVDRHAGTYPGCFLAPDLRVRSLVELAEKLA
jgi:2-haloacid dehalogenase